MPRDFEQRRHDVDVVDELLAQGALVLDVPGQEMHHVLADAAEPEAFCLNQLNGVSNAHDQPADMWLYAFRLCPRHRTTSSASLTGLDTPLKKATSLYVPCGPLRRWCRCRH